MDYRRYSLWAERAVIAAVAVLQVVVFVWPENPSKPNYLLLAAHDAQLLSAIVLIIGWVVLGPGRLWIRLAAAPVLVGLWFLPWNGQMQPRETPETFVATVFFVSVVLVGGLRAIGLRIEKRSASAGPERGAQFSLLGLLVATTAIAAVIGGLEAMRPTLGSSSRGEFIDMSDSISVSPSSLRQGQQVRQIVMAASVVLAAVGGLWVTLRPGAPWFRLAALAGLIPAISVYLTHLSNGPGGLFIATAEGLAVGFAGVAVVTCISVLPLRMHSLRLQRHVRPVAEAVAGHSVQRPWNERVAAVVLLGLAAATIPWTREQMEQSRLADYRRITGWDLSWGIIRNGNELVPPLNVFGEWVDRRLVVSLDDGSWLNPYMATVRARHLLTTTPDDESLIKEASRETDLEQP